VLHTGGEVWGRLSLAIFAGEKGAFGSEWKISCGTEEILSAISISQEKFMISDGKQHLTAYFRLLSI